LTLNLNVVLYNILFCYLLYTRNRFLNIVSLTHCIICVLYESLFVNNESRNIGLKQMRLSFHFFIHSFIRLSISITLCTIPNFICTYAFGVEARLVFVNFSNATRPIVL